MLAGWWQCGYAWPAPSPVIEVVVRGELEAIPLHTARWALAGIPPRDPRLSGKRVHIASKTNDQQLFYTPSPLPLAQDHEGVEDLDAYTYQALWLLRRNGSTV